MGTFSHAPELIVLLIVALVIFGPKKLPDMGKGLGEGIREFRRSMSGESEPEAPVTEAPATAAPTTQESPKADAARQETAEEIAAAAKSS